MRKFMTPAFAFLLSVASLSATASVVETARDQANRTRELAHTPVELPSAANVNPDVLRDLFVSSFLMHCEKQVCMNVAGKVPVPVTEENYVEGYSVVFESGVLERNLLDRKKLQPYYPWLSDLYQQLYADLK
uniref:Uncharacterized protein n=1 Tax=Pseudomonas phage RVTF4 TaxID=3236931 RepID=A0AB39CCE4_9VIRU